MKLCCVYNVFDGIELLLNTIKRIKDQVDYIIIHYQDIDYYGKNKLSSKDLKLLKELPVDELLLFKVKYPAKNSMTAKLLERQKRNQAIKRANQLGYDYYINSDADEFFDNLQFQKAKEYVEQEHIQYSYCHYQNYFKNDIREKSISVGMIPFICRTKKLITSNDIPIVIDPTRGFEVKNEKYKIFGSDDLLMQHATGIRDNLISKYESSSLSNINRERINDITDSINNLNENNLILTFYGKNNLPVNIECEMCDQLF